jgi:deaminated glutathione amidase
MLVDPMGAVRLDLGSSPAIVAGDVDTEMTARVRSVLPSLEHRRPDIFAGAGEFSGAGEAIRA